MPYAHNVHRVTLSGTTFGGAEQWSTGFYVGAVGEGVSNPTQQFADAVRTAWTAFFTNSGVSISSVYKTDNVKVAQVGVDGKTHPENVVYAPFGTPISGGGGTLVLPAQIALAASLENAGARGLAAKGRMYLPGINITVSNIGQLSTVQVSGILTPFKTFIDAVNAAAPLGAKVILASQGKRAKQADGSYDVVPGTAVNAVVNRVRVGSVYDTQRRRRNQLVEAYQSAAID